MNTLYKKSELSFALCWIGLYVVVLSAADSFSTTLGTEKLITAPLCIAMTVFVYLWLCKQGLLEKYGLCPIRGKAAEHLYFLPLIALVSVNLWWGIHLQMTPVETVLYIISMLCVGFLEEIIFRGFLFKALCRDGLKTAIIVSSVTFGFGHIVNLLSGAELIPTLIQIVYAVATGFAFTLLFLKSGSLWPCILTHSAINALSAFADSSLSLPKRLTSGLFLTIVSLGYALYYLKKEGTPHETHRP